MSHGRNEPCYCGSGKKYKKCCLPKDEKPGHKKEAKLANTTVEPQSAIEHKTRNRAPDRRVEACEARFREFEAAEYEERLALFVHALDDPDLTSVRLNFSRIE
jgi:hypothetical protein